MKSSYQKFGKEVLIIGVVNVLMSLSGFITLPLLTKTLGVHDYGIWSQVHVTIGLAWAFVNLGLPFAMVRFLAAKTNKEEIQEGFYSVFSIVSLLALIASSLLIVFAGPVAEALFDGATEIVRITGFIILATSLNNLCLHLFRTFRQMKKYSIFLIADTYGQVGIIAYLILNGYGLLSVVLSLLAVKAIIFLILFYLVNSQIGIKRPRYSQIGEYLSFGLPTIPQFISAWVVTSSDRYVIGYFLGVAAVGTYSAGYGLGSVILMLPAVLGLLLPAALFKLYDEGRMDEVKTHLSYALKYFLALAIPFVFGATILSRQILTVFSTTEIASQGYCIVPLIALSSLFSGIYTVIGHIILLVKKTKIIGMTWLIAAAVNLGLNVLIVPHVGIFGAAITTLIAYLLAMGIITYYSFREFKFKIEWGFIIKSLIASAIMSLVIWQINPTGTLSVILAVVIGIAVYAAIILSLKGFKKEEIQYFKGLLRRG